MSHFVDDETTLPTDKTNARPLTGPASKSIQASEINATNQAAIDLRDALLNGKRLVLQSDSAQPVAASGKVAFRNNGGHLEISKDGGDYHRVEAPIRPEDYGAVGDGTTNDGPALQLAIDASAAENRPLIFDAKIYATAQELVIANPNHQVWKGTQYSSGQHTVIKAIASMRAVLTASINVWLEDIVLDGNRLALTGFYAQTVSLSGFTRVSVGNCLRDGITFPGENDNTHHVSEDVTLEMLRFFRASNCWVPASKRNALTGVRATVTSGSTQVDFTGTVDLTTLGIVTSPAAQAIIIIKNGDTIYKGHVASITNGTRLVLNDDVFDNPPTFTAAGCSFSISNFTHAINDTNSFYDFSSGGNGEVWGTSGVLDEHQVPSSMKTEMDTVSAEVTDGSAVVTFTGSIDLYSMKLRSGDWIRVGAGDDARFSIILSVDSPTQLTAASNFDYTDTGLDWVIASGDGYHECPSSDNGINSFQGSSLHRSNAGCAFAFNGLYGPLVIGNQIDYQGFYGIRVGNNGTVVIAPCFIRIYNEASGSGKTFYVAGTLGMTVISPIDLAGNVEDNIDYAGNSQGNGWTGVYLNRDNMDPIGSGVPMNLNATKLLNPTLDGMVVGNGASLLADSPTGGFSYDVDGTTTLYRHFHPMYPGGPDTLLTGTPTFTVSGKQGNWTWMTVDTNQQGAVILQDDSFLSGTKLKLSSNRVRIGRGDAILLFCDGNYWFELGRVGSKDVQGLTTESMVAGSVVARKYDATAHTGLPPRSICKADAATGGTVSHPIGVVTGLINFGGTDTRVQTTGEVHIPDSQWTGGTPADTDVGAPVYLSDTASKMSLTPGTRVVRLGVLQRGGTGECMVDLNIEPPAAAMIVDRADHSATIGADTQDRLGGKNTLANGATSVVVTSNKCKSTSHVVVTWNESPGQFHWVVPADGSFTVNVDADPGADITFTWTILG